MKGKIFLNVRAVFQKTSTKPGVSYRSVAGIFSLGGIGAAGAETVRALAFL
jgi:hypothetical protein